MTPRGVGGPGQNAVLSLVSADSPDVNSKGPVIDRWESGRHALPMVVRVDSVSPLLDSAVGLVFLAHLPESQSRSALAGQQERQVTRTVAPEEQERIVAEGRRRGDALNRIHGVAAYGAPVLGAGSLAASVGLAKPARTLAECRTAGLAAQLLEAAAEASATLGHVPGTGSDVRAESREVALDA